MSYHSKEADKYKYVGLKSRYNNKKPRRGKKANLFADTMCMHFINEDRPTRELDEAYTREKKEEQGW